jgi:hypothetical protein
MPKVIVTAEVGDAAQWEKGFRSHADMFRNLYGIRKPIQFTVVDGNQVAVCFEADDLEAFMKGFNAPETVEAMAVDGVNRETAKVYVLNAELAL